MTIRRPLPLLALLGSLLLTTAAFATEDAAPAAGEEELRVVDLHGVTSIDGIMETLKRKQVVFVGETHDHYADHLNQLEIIRRLHRQKPDLAIGMEYFQWPFQEALDRYIAGKTDERRFLQQSEYYKRWRFDYRLYQPILRFARQEHIPVLALNVPAELTHKVATGGLAALSPAERAEVPKHFDRSDEAYRARLRKIFAQHQGKQQAGNFDHFYDAQLLWDESMAATAARWLQDNPGRSLVILAGAGHLMYGSGIPSRLVRRVPAASAIVLNGMDDALNPGAGDYLLVGPDRELPPQGLMGAYLSDDDGGVILERLEEKSGAAAAGLKAGDRVLSIDGFPIKEYADVKIAMLGQNPGSKVAVVVERKMVMLGSQTVTATVELH